MTETNTHFDIEETLEPGLRYTEEVALKPGAPPTDDVRRPQRDCKLWAEGVDEPVSGLEIFSFQKRFGAIALPSEGIGGVNTDPKHRQRGYIRKLLTRVRQSMASRADVGFVSEAIEGLYEKFGFVNCLTEGHFVLPLRFVDRLHAGPLQGGRSLRPFTPDDLPAMAALYNEIHAQRPWTHVRPSSWNQLRAPRTWEPGSAVILLADGAVLAGYAIVTERRFGVVHSPYIIHELAARDAAAAQALLAEAASICADQGATEMWLREPLDSTAGRVARGLGGEYRLRFPATGGMMGGIFHRAALLGALEPELRRRLGAAAPTADHDAAFALLEQGELIPDDQTLLRLLLGYWSADDAAATAATDLGDPAERYTAVLAAWFPGGGAPSLPQAYAHHLDRY